MTCANCGTDNPAGAHFCGGCGTTLPQQATPPTVPPPSICLLYTSDAADEL